MQATVGTSGLVRNALDRLLFRIGAPETAPIRLGQRRIYLLPTPAGLAFALALLVMLIASINYNLSLGYGLVFLLAGTAVASIVHAFRNLLGLSISPGRCDPVFCGDDAVFHLVIDNPRGLRRPALSLRAHGCRTAFDLDASAQGDIALACPTSRRGSFAIGRTILETSWPLGLIRAWSVFVPDLRCLVYPAPEPEPPPLPAQQTGHVKGEQPNGEGDDDFAGLRAHQRGDSPRHVAWKVLARGGPMLVKQFSGHGGDDVVLDWAALPPSMDDEARLSRLAAWLLTAERSGCPYALRLPAARQPAGRGEAQLRRCLQRLALFGIEVERPADA